MLLAPLLFVSIAAALPAATLTDDDATEVETRGFLQSWTGTFNVGLNYADGNTDIRAASVDFDAERRVGDNRYIANAYWNYSKQKAADGGDFELTQRNAAAHLKYNRFFSEKTYGWVDAMVMTDELAMLDLRWTTGAGLGYQFIDLGVDEDGKRVTKPGHVDNLRGEIGLTYFNEEFDDGMEDEFIAAQAMFELGMDLTGTMRFENKTTVFPSLEDADDVYGNATTRVKADLTDSMFAQVQWKFLYDNTPAAGAERTDNRVSLGLGWTF
ncbi:MAG: DUF481 domain-containing protein [Planctomycetota bacterium]